jgi:hypothetical protein
MPDMSTKEILIIFSKYNILPLISVIFVPLTNRLKPLERYQFGKKSIVNLFAYLISVWVIYFSFSQKNTLHLFPNFPNCILFGTVLLVITFVLGAIFSKIKSVKKQLPVFLITLTLYSSAVGFISFGTFSYVLLNSYLILTGKVVIGKIEDLKNKDWDFYSAPPSKYSKVVLVGNIKSNDFIISESKTDSNGKFQFLVSIQDAKKITTLYPRTCSSKEFIQNIEWPIEKINGSEEYIKYFSLTQPLISME